MNITIFDEIKSMDTYNKKVNRGLIFIKPDS